MIDFIIASELGKGNMITIDLIGYDPFSYGSDLTCN